MFFSRHPSNDNDRPLRRSCRTLALHSHPMGFAKRTVKRIPRRSRTPLGISNLT